MYKVSPGKQRSSLAARGLCGKIRIHSEMTEEDVLGEIRSTFQVAMGNDNNFPFRFLQIAGGGSKSLTVPVLSASFTWTPKEVAKLAGQGCLYIQAQAALNEHSCDSDEEIDLTQNEETTQIHDSCEQTSLFTHTTRTGHPVDEVTATNSSKPSVSERHVVQPPLCNRDEVLFLSSDPESDDSDNDIYLQHAVENSLWTEAQGPSTEAIIRQARQDFLPEFDVTAEDSTTFLQVRRKHIWKDSLRAFKQRGFTPRKWLKIEFVGESAIDEGGPRREYFRLGMQELQRNNALFQGALGKRVPSHNLQLLSNKEYRDVGRFFAMSILQGGPSPQFLSPTVAHYLLQGDEGLQPEISEIPDSEIRAKVQKITEVQNTQELQALLMKEEYDFRYACGYTKPVANLTTSNVKEIVLCLALHFIIYSNKAELDQISEGLKLGGLIWVDNEVNSLTGLFIQKSETLSARAVRLLFSPKLSEPGANRREVEEEMLLHWSYFLSDVEEGSITVESGEQISTLTLEDILAFATGATSFPVLGFEQQGTITFLHDGGMFPTASTCSLQVCLPVHRDYEVFKAKMAFGILNAHGFFGNV